MSLFRFLKRFFNFIRGNKSNSSSFPVVSSSRSSRSVSHGGKLRGVGYTRKDKKVSKKRRKMAIRSRRVNRSRGF